MRFVVVHEGNPHDIGFARVLNCPLWSEKQTSAFDMFAEYGPTDVICSTRLTEPFVKACLKYKPNVYLKLNDFSQIYSTTSQMDFELTKLIFPLVKKTFTTHTQSNMKFVENWNLDPISLPVAFDGRPRQEPWPNPAYCGPYVNTEGHSWVLRWATLNKFDIFGNWPCTESLGPCTEITQTRVLSGLTLNLLSDDSVSLLTGLSESTFNSIGCGGSPLVRDTVAARDMFGDGVEYYNSFEDLQFKKKKPKFKIVGHTYRDRLEKLIG